MFHRSVEETKTGAGRELGGVFKDKTEVKNSDAF